MIIALGYKKQVGKDTVAAYLKHQYRFRRIALAARVKRAAQVAFDMSAEDCETEEGKNALHPKLNVRNRFILQKLADAVKGVFGETVWLKMLELENLDPSLDYVISDMRFRYEFDAIKRAGGTCIRIDRRTVSAELHVSEHNLTAIGDKAWDFIVDNNGTQDELYAKIDAIMEKFGR